mgnify:CR=1 FL=1
MCIRDRGERLLAEPVRSAATTLRAADAAPGERDDASDDDDGDDGDGCVWALSAPALGDGPPETVVVRAPDEAAALSKAVWRLVRRAAAAAPGGEAAAREDVREARRAALLAHNADTAPARALVWDACRVLHAAVYLPERAAPRCSVEVRCSVLSRADVLRHRDALVAAVAEAMSSSSCM